MKKTTQRAEAHLGGHSTGRPRLAGAARIVAVTLALLTPSTVYGQVSLDFLLTLGQNQQALDSSTVLNPRFRLGIPTSKNLRVNMEWGLITAAVPQFDEDGTETGSSQETRFLNPNVEVKYSALVQRWSYNFRFHIALGMAFPAADADTPAQLAAYQVAISAAGAWDPWLYLPNTLAFVLPIQVEADFRDFRLMVDTATYLLFPTEDSRDRSTQFGPQVGIEGATEVGMFDLGVRFQLVQVGDSGDSEGSIHTSIVPLARLYVGPAVVHGRFNLNFGTGGNNSPLAAAGTWGFSFGIGFNF